MDLLTENEPDYEQICYQNIWTSSFINQLSQYKIDNVSTKDETYFAIPLKSILNLNPSDQKVWYILIDCLIKRCKGKINSDYILDMYRKCDMLIIADDNKPLNSRDNHRILGFVMLQLMPTDIWMKYIEPQVNKEYNKSYTDYIKVYKPLQSYVTKNSTIRTGNMAYITLICSDAGVGGELLNIVESENFRKQFNLKYDQVSLKAVPTQYTFYTFKHHYLRTADCKTIHPAFIYDGQYVYDYGNSKTVNARNMINYINKDAFYDNDDFILSKYLPIGNSEKTNFASWLKENNIVLSQSQKAGAITKNKVKLSGVAKVYVVRIDSDKKKYIMRDRQKIYLRSLAGKYRYV